MWLACWITFKRIAVIDWSDGAIVGLDMAIHNPKRLTELFAFAANSDPSGVKDVDQSLVFTAFIARAENEYAKLSPTPDQYKAFLDQIRKMWETQPNFTAEQLLAIKVRTWIVDADHDEAIKRENTLFMADQVPGAGLLLQPEVSHFSFLQDPAQFNSDLLHFLLAKRPGEAPSAQVSVRMCLTGIKFGCRRYQVENGKAALRKTVVTRRGWFTPALESPPL